MEKFDINNEIPEIVGEIAEPDEYLKLLKEHFYNITDGLGKHIDRGIVDTVAVFTAVGYLTDQSCEGHSKERGLPFAWVDFQSDFMNTDEGQEYRDLRHEYAEFYDMKKKDGLKISNTDYPKYSRLKELREKVKNEDIKLKENLNNLLKEFYLEKGGVGFDYAAKDIFLGAIRIMPIEAIKMDDELFNKRRDASSEDWKGLVSEYDNFDEIQKREWVEKSQKETQRITAYLREGILKTKNT